MKALEPIILSTVLLLLAVGAAGLAYTYPSVSDITGITTLEPKGHGAKKIKSEDIDATLASWNSPVLWNEPASKHRLFNPVDFLFYPSLYPQGDYIKPLDNKARSTGGVLLSWYQSHNMDFTSATIDREDPDNDGFSNVVEFKNEQVGQQLKAADCDGSKSTNPVDGQSHPGYLSRLRLQKYEKRPFHIQFRGYQELNGGFVFQIYLKDVDSGHQPPLKKTGDPLGFEGYTVGAFKQSIVEETDPQTHLKMQVDESTLELDKPEIDYKISVPFRKEVDSPESTGNFVILMPSEVNKVIKVARGKVLTVPFISDVSYLIIDVKDTGATIRDTKTKQDFNIPLLDAAEWDEVPEASQTNQGNPLK